jgi:hypothetical protein
LILGTIGWRYSNKNRANCRNSPELGDSYPPAVLRKRDAAIP